jgi:imidazolonepropionase-like amidohydrolase
VVDPHGLNAMELTIAREAGFSDAEVIELATVANARCLGIDAWTGTVEEGKVADLIVVDGRPDEDVAVLTDSARIRSVLVAGREVKAQAEVQA